MEVIHWIKLQNMLKDFAKSLQTSFLTFEPS